MQFPDSLCKAIILVLPSRLLDSPQDDWATLGGDVLYAVSAKLIRRIRKLESTN